MDNQEIEVPSYFLCPISLQIMRDPVTVSTGITYDRESIEKWLFTNNNTTCPVTKQVLNDTDSLTPNHTLRRLIQSWCTLNASYGVERFPTPKPPVTKPQILKLIREFPLSKSKCLNKLKSIALESSANKVCLESSGAVEFLCRVILEEEEVDHSNSSDALSILAHLHITEERLRKLLEETGLALMDSLARMIAMQRTNCESRAYAIILMKSLLQAGRPAQLAALKREHFTEVVLIIRDQVSPKASREALKVLNLACPWGRNRIRAVEAGAVPVLVDLLVDASSTEERRMNEMALAVLVQLCGCAEGRAELLGHGAGLAVVSKKILRVSHFATEKGVGILSLISKFSASPAVVQEMVVLGVVTKLCLVLQVDCDAKTKEKARQMFKLHAKAWSNSPCAPPPHALAASL